MSESEKSDFVFGEVLRECRKAVAKSQEKLALDSNLERVFISMLERGQRQPTLKTLMSLSRGLGMPLSQLIEKFEQHYFLKIKKRIHEE